jgi:RadC-like JAB domain
LRKGIAAPPNQRRALGKENEATIAPLSISLGLYTEEVWHNPGLVSETDSFDDLLTGPEPRWSDVSRAAKQEYVFFGYENAQSSKMVWKVATSGHRSHVKLDVRSIVREALDRNCFNIKLAHNHLSGIASPSQQDISSTRMLERCCHPLRINIADHVIFTNDEVFSFKDAGLL